MGFEFDEQVRERDRSGFVLGLERFEGEETVLERTLSWD